MIRAVAEAQVRKLKGQTEELRRKAEREAWKEVPDVPREQGRAVPVYDD